MPYTIEVYEFEIKNYHQKESRGFGVEQLCAVPCGTIEAYSKLPHHAVHQASVTHSCDLLESGKNPPQQTPKTAWELLYTQFPTKLTASELASRLKHKKLRQILGYKAKPIISLIRKAVHKLDQLSQGVASQLRESLQSNLPFFLLGDSSVTSAPTSYILHLPTHDHVIVMGDLHGSFHTFWRNILRLYAGGILTSLDSLTLKCGYTLIFTGDVVDRGNYALDIIIIILRLISQNPVGKVIYNRGNHEEQNIASKFGFGKELEIKLPDACDDDDLEVLTKDGIPVYKGCRPANYLLWYLQTFWVSCPCAIVVENKNGERIWLSHGGIPLQNPPPRLLNKEAVSTPVAIPLNAEQTNACMWFDFFFSPGQRGWSTHSGTGRTKIYPSYVVAFMKQNGLDFIVRGHQDNYVNTYLLSDFVPQGPVNAHGSRFDIKGPYGPHNKIKVYGPDKVKGPIARIVTGPAWWTVSGLEWTTPEGNVHAWPVLTVSTATDLGRRLMKDSMIQILPFQDESGKYALRCPV